MAEVGVRDGGYIHNVVLHKGWLFKRTHGAAMASNFQYRKRYFELSNAAILYGQNEKKTGVGGISQGCGCGVKVSLVVDSVYIVLGVV